MMLARMRQAAALAWGRGARTGTRRGRRVATRGTVGLLLVCACGGAVSHSQGLSSPEMLDLRGYDVTFEDRFTTLSISDQPGSGTRWYNHTPWGGDFGDAAFAPPGPNGPFSAGQGGLTITARRGADGRWTSGLISSRDRDGPQGRGFVQQYGYFEMSAKLPSGMGTWPAFWLMGVNKEKSSAEIDVVEYYGGFPKAYDCIPHVWKDGKDALNKSFRVKVEDGSLSSRFNTFGVLIEPTTTSFYHNRQRVAELPTPPEYHQPFYILANLALGSGFPTADLASPSVMQVAYIRVYRRRGQGGG